MIKVFQILEEEKEAINLVNKNDYSMAESLIKDEGDTAVIMRATGLTKEEIEKSKRIC